MRLLRKTKKGFFYSLVLCALATCGLVSFHGSSTDFSTYRTRFIHEPSVLNYMMKNSPAVVQNVGKVNISQRTITHITPKTAPSPTNSSFSNTHKMTSTVSITTSAVFPHYLELSTKSRPKTTTSLPKKLTTNSSTSSKVLITSTSSFQTQTKVVITTPKLITSTTNKLTIPTKQLVNEVTTTEQPIIQVPVKLNTKWLEPSRTSTLRVCPVTLGGLGNQLFQFATAFGIAASKNMSLVIPKAYPVVNVFQINERFLDENDTACKSFKGRWEKLSCGYDPNLSNFDSNSSYRIGPYLQSWKYFVESADALRKQLVFKSNIQTTASNIINSTLSKYNVSSRIQVTLVGVHVRRGDLVNHRYGYMVASSDYLVKAVNYFKTKFNSSKIIFIVCSNGMEWVKENIPKNISVEYISGNKAEVDMAVLKSCDHSISTVGTFSWWSAWLAGGVTTYYKWPAREGSGLRRAFSKTYFDFFYPGWVGF